MNSITEAKNSFFSNISLQEYIGAIFAIFVGISSVYSARISKRVEKGIEKLTDYQSYNKNRKRIADELKECTICLKDENVEIDLTNASKMQASIQKMMQYSKIFSKKEQRKLDEMLILIREGEYTITERTIMLENFNCFIAKLEKGDIVI